MRITRVSSFAAELEVDADTLADASEPGGHRASTALAKEAVVVFLLVDALFRRRWVEVERLPRRGERVVSVGMCIAPGRDGGLHSLLTDVALSFSQYVSGSAGIKDTHGQTVSLTTVMLNLVILTMIEA